MYTNFFLTGVDHVIHLWDLANGNLVAVLKGHTSTIYALCFSREGAILASGDFFILFYFFYEILKRRHVTEIFNL